MTDSIIQYAIPYRLAAATLGRITPTVLLTLIERMSPEEVVANAASLTRRGAMENPYLKGRVDRKLKETGGAAPVVAEEIDSLPVVNEELLARILNHPLPRRKSG